jgi:hypothetical protein
MTIAVSVKINDGIVMAADSATTLMDDKQNIVTVFNHANKIVNLCKGVPLGVMTWGAGSIGTASMATLFKDFRLCLAGNQDSPYKLDLASYSIQSVAQSLHDFLVAEAHAGGHPIGVLGISVCGYSAKAQLPEEWQVNFDRQGQVGQVTCVQDQNNCGINWNGQPEAISRLINGIGSEAIVALSQMAADPTQVPALVEAIRVASVAQLVYPPMPIQDAIELAQWLVHTTEMYSRFTPEPPTVGGAIEIASITKHEGFKWIRRKLFFDAAINPFRGGHYEDGWAENGVQH